MVKELKTQIKNGLSEGKGIQRDDQNTKRPQLLNHTIIGQPQRIRRASSNVGFSASINGNIGVVSSQVLVFGREVTNVDHRYSTRNGHFTAPYEGLYFFTVSIVAMPNKYIETEIVHNGVPLCYIYSGEGSGYYGPGTNSVVVQLAAGDDVYVRVRGGQHGSGSVIDGVYSTFTGFFLSPNV
ncbi:complement C1q-like protein 2 [Saccostrea cucullata]|uniref:complement C1q-like protein 2 n=1 Tax=Saccostrea cuccullata TaxID=36930 RepID=UPI002ED64010